MTETGVGVSESRNGTMALDVAVPLESLGRLLLVGALLFALIGAGIFSLKFINNFEPFYGLYALFDLDSDLSIPTWFSSMGLLSCSILLWIHSTIDGKAPRATLWHWRILALIFLLLSVDEVARIHELFGSFVGYQLVPNVSDRTGGILSYQWLVAGFGLAGVVAVSYIPFLYRLPRRFALGFILAGALYVCGGGVTESFNGHTKHLLTAHSVQYMTGTVLEEFLEMVGVALFAEVLVRYLASRVQAISLTSRFVREAPSAEWGPATVFGDRSAVARSN